MGQLSNHGPHYCGTVAVCNVAPTLSPKSFVGWAERSEAHVDTAEEEHVGTALRALAHPTLAIAKTDAYRRTRMSADLRKARKLQLVSLVHT